MQLVAYGAQDIYLTGNPMITYFKVVYRRHTNFAMESIEQTFNGNVGFGNKVTALISRNGDLVSGLSLEVVLPHLQSGATDTKWTDSVGHYLIEEVSVEIGGQQIDKHYSDWLEIWAQLSMPLSKRSAYYELIGLDGAGRGLQSPKDNTEYIQPGANLNADGQRVLYIPLQFWFCRNVGLALPLIALQYHEVKVAVTFRGASSMYCSGSGAGTATVQTSPSGLSATLWADYIYLDTDERRRFAQVSHEYLIEQLQHNSFSYTTGSVNGKLTFNHPVKELVWVCRESANTNAMQWSNFTHTLATATESHARPTTTETGTSDVTSKALMDAIRAAGTAVSENVVQKAKLRLNGHDRMAEREGVYFNRQQTLDHHTASPASPGINVYSFALKPEDHQPSGTCNFSRIDNAELNVTLHAAATGGVLHVYAVNYNVLRIMSGMGGLAYSN